MTSFTLSNSFKAVGPSFATGLASCSFVLVSEGCWSLFILACVITKNLLATDFISVGSLLIFFESRDDSLEFIDAFSTELECSVSAVLENLDSFIDEYELRDETLEASEIEEYEFRAELGVESDADANEVRSEVGNVFPIVESNSGRESISLPRLSAF